MSSGKWKRKRKSKMKTQSIAEPYSETTSTADPIKSVFPYTLKTKLILRMDKIMDGSFAGLYQLVSIKENGDEVILTDANAIQYVIPIAHKAFMGAL